MADRFVKGTLILTAAGLMVKILASVNRIFLSRLLGGEGIGLYQLAYPLYNLLVGIVAAGIPAAMSLIVARYAAKKEWGSVHRVVTVSFPFLALLGLAVSLAAYGLIPCLFSSGLIKDERALVPMLFCVPALLLTVPLAGLRGYFQGFQEMRPTALSQILEQFFRVAFMLVLSVWLLPKGLAWRQVEPSSEQLRGPLGVALPSFLLPTPAARLEAGGQGPYPQITHFRIFYHP